MNGRKVSKGVEVRDREKDSKRWGKNDRHVFSLTRRLPPLDLLLALVIVGARGLLRAVPVVIRLVRPVGVNVARGSPRPRRSAVR